MALVAAAHHSTQPNAALRGQKTGIRASEEDRGVRYPPTTEATSSGVSCQHLCLRLQGRSGATAPCGAPQGTLFSWWYKKKKEEEEKRRRKKEQAEARKQELEEEVLEDKL